MAIEIANHTILIPNTTHVADAELVAKWTHEGTTVEHNHEEVMKWFEMGRSVLLQSDGVTVAHAAITYAWPDNWMELGAVITEKQCRQKGLGHLVVNILLSMARDKYPDSKFMAICNEMSLPIFLRYGGQIMDGRELPTEVWGACNQCPNFQKAKAAGKVCCDTPVNMTEAGI